MSTSPNFNRTSSRVANLANLWEGVSSKASEAVKKEKEIKQRQRNSKNLTTSFSRPILSKPFSQTRADLINKTNPRENRRNSETFSKPILQRSDSTLSTPISSTSRIESFREILELEEIDYSIENNLRKIGEKIANWPDPSQRLLPIHDIPVRKKKFEYPYPPEALYSNQSIRNSSLDLDQLQTPLFNVDSSIEILRAANSVTLTLSVTLSEEQQLLGIPYFNSSTVYSACQLEKEICPVLKSLGKRVKAIHDNKLDVSIDIILGIPDLIYQLITITRRCANLEFSKDIIPFVKLTISLYLSLLFGLGTSVDSQITMFYNLIADNLLSILNVVKLAATAEKKQIAKKLSPEELSKLTKTSATSIQQLYKMIIFVNQMKQTLKNENINSQNNNDYDQIKNENSNFSNLVNQNQKSTSNIPCVLNQIIGHLSSSDYFSYESFVENVQKIFQATFAYGVEKGFNLKKWEKLQEKGNELIKANISLLSKLAPIHIVTDKSLNEVRLNSLRSFTDFLNLCLE